MSNWTVHFWQTILYTDNLMILAIVMNYLQTFSHSCSYYVVSQCQNKADRYKDTLKVPLLVYEPFPKIHSYCHWTGQIEKHKAFMRFWHTMWTICCFINCCLFSCASSSVRLQNFISLRGEKLNCWVEDGHKHEIILLKNHIQILTIKI